MMYWVVAVFLSRLFTSVDVKSASLVLPHDIYLDAKAGRDEPNCGSNAQPCKTINFAWSINKRQENKVQFVLEPSAYSSEDVVDLNCNNRCKSITIRSNAVRFLHAQLGSNFLVTNCEFKLMNVIVGNPFNRLQHSYYFSNITLQNVTLRSTRVNIFGQESTISLHYCHILNCSSTFGDLPIFIAKSFGSSQSHFAAEHVVFKDNHAGFALMESLEVVTLKDMEFAHSSMETLRVFEPSVALHINGVKTLVMSSILFVNNTNFVTHVSDSEKAVMDELKVEKDRVLSNHPLFSFGNGHFALSSASFIENIIDGSAIEVRGNAEFKCNQCKFVCNVINGSMVKSPIAVSKSVKVSLTSSNATNCPVVCDGGHFLQNNLLCLPCSRGTFSGSSNVSRKTCLRCPAGSYTKEEGSEMCRPCPKGSFCPSLGCVACKKCRNDFFVANEGASSCSQPTVLFVTLVAITGCLILLPGFILLGNKFRKAWKLKDLKSNADWEDGDDKGVLIINSR